MQAKASNHEGAGEDAADEPEKPKVSNYNGA